MEFRQRMIECAIKGFDTHDLHFIDGCNPSLSALGGDDMGIVYFATLIHSSFGTDTLASAQAVIYTLLVVSLILGWLGALVAFKELKQRLLVTLGFGLLAIVSLISHAGVYAASSAIAIAVIPWLVAVFRSRSGIQPWQMYWTFFLTGVSFGLTDFMRAYAGAPVLVFALTLLTFSRYGSYLVRLFSVLALVVGITGPMTYFGSLFQDRDAYIWSQHSTYSPPLKRHLFWHTAYIGLGYTVNDFGVVWSDTHAFAALEQRAPGTPQLSAASERIHKDLFMETLTQHPVFAVMNTAAKAGVLAVMIILFANIGLLVRGNSGLPPPIRLAFLTSTMIASSYGILAIPAINYTTQLVVIAALYGIFTLAIAQSHGLRRSLIAPFGRGI